MRSYWIPAFVAALAARVYAGADHLPPEREKIVRIQVFLDAAHFRPGIIDGKWGEFTQKALAAYCRTKGVELENSARPPKTLPGLEQIEAFTEATISESDSKHVGELPKTVEAKSTARQLPYTSITELIAERFHCRPELLTELNPGLKIDALGAGEKIRVPAVAEPFDISHPKSGDGDSPRSKKRSEANGGAKPSEKSNAAKLVIDSKESTLQLLRKDGEVVAFYPITPGSEKRPAPRGRWKVESISRLPVFRYDEKMLKEGERSDDALKLPPGPNSPIGVVWIGLNKDGIGIHGTDAPETIGRSVSHGCIRMANWDISDLSEWVKASTPVLIDAEHDSPEDSAGE